MSYPIRRFVELCLQEAGDTYVYGAEVNLTDPNPPGPFDCSELVQWASYQASGGNAAAPDGSAAQLQYCRDHATTISVQQAIDTRGALLFIQTSGEHHVAVSLGDGHTIEARGHAYGVGSWNAPGRPWTHGGLLPGFDYLPGAPAPTSTTEDDMFNDTDRNALNAINARTVNIQAVEEKYDALLPELKAHLEATVTATLSSDDFLDALAARLTRKPA